MIDHKTFFRRLIITWGIALILFILISAGGTLQAQGNPTAAPTAAATLRPVNSDEVNQIARRLYCPVCQNVPLEVCDTAACEQWREQIRQMLAEGQTEEQIRAYFIQVYGVRTVGIPTSTIAQIQTIAIPLVIIAVIGIVVVVTLFRWRRQTAVESGNQSPPDSIETANAAPSTTPGDEYRARVEAELKDLDK